MENTYDDGKSSTFGKQLMSYVMSKLPYSGLDMNQMADQMNPKYRYFENTGERRAEVLSKYSVTQNHDYNNQGVSNISSDKRYSQVMYANIQKDKAARIKDYRIMAAFSEVAKALDEICDEVINVDTNNNSCTELKIKDIQVSEFEYETLQKEFKKYVSYFDFEHKGWSYFRQLLVEGEVFWEHIIHEEYKEEGILGVVQIPTELVDPVFSNVQNVMVKGYLYRKPIYDPKNPMKQVKVEYVPLDKNQVTYVHSDVWNEAKTMRLPFLENARRAYRQLSMLEDSIIIYRLARAPERLVFNVDVGNMPHPKAEAYLKKLVSQYWSSKTYDPDQGGIVQKFNPQSILDNFWFAKRTGSEGTSVISLPGGQNLGQLDDLMYFVKKLYQSLNVPTTRLDPQDAFRDGADMLREELKFAKFIVRLQQEFAAGIKNGFVTHLQLKGLMKDFELKEHNLDITFNVPTNFYEVRQQQKIELKTSTFGNIANIPSVSQTYAQKKYLGWTDLDIKANREFLRKDKAFNWELQQIENLGPDWKEQIKAQAEAMGGGMGPDAGGGGGMPPMGGGGGGGGGMPPPFAGGEATVGGDAGGEAPPPEAAGGAPAPEAAPSAGGPPAA
jgi:hypothetical protein